MLRLESKLPAETIAVVFILGEMLEWKWGLRPLHHGFVYLDEQLLNMTCPW